MLYALFICHKIYIKPMLLLLFSHPGMSDFLWLHGLQHTRPPCSSPSLEVCPSSCSLHRWCCPAISSSDALFSFCPQSSPGHQGLFQWVICSHQMTKILELELQYQSFQWIFRVDLPLCKIDWFDLRCPRDFQESSLASCEVCRYQFFGVLPSLQSSSHKHTWPLGIP